MAQQYHPTMGGRRAKEECWSSPNQFANCWRTRRKESLLANWKNVSSSRDISEVGLQRTGTVKGGRRGSPILKGSLRSGASASIQGTKVTDGAFTLTDLAQKSHDCRLYMSTNINEVYWRADAYACRTLSAYTYIASKVTQGSRITLDF